MPVTYTVRPGDTLAAIAKKHGVKLGVLIDTNGITDPNKLRVGQVLAIPAFTTDAQDHPAPVEAPPAASSPAALAVDQSRFRLTPQRDFFAEVFPKDLIVLHYTAGGSAKSAFDTWVGAPIQVATAYVIDLDGTIYEFFDPKFWAFHLGVSGPNRTHRDHKRSIGIEIVNVGGLKEDGANQNQLNWWPPVVNNVATYKTPFCKKSETAKYVAAPYRGLDFHAAFPEVQVAQTVKLVRHLCTRFSIPKQIPPPAKRQEPKADLAFAQAFKGVISHQSFISEKLDIGPAWDWSRLFG